MLARESETVKVGGVEWLSLSGINGNQRQGSFGQRLAQRRF
jgi:hypothetical protein